MNQASVVHGVKTQLGRKFAKGVTLFLRSGLQLSRFQRGHNDMSCRLGRTRVLMQRTYAVVMGVRDRIPGDDPECTANAPILLEQVQVWPAEH